MFSLNDLTWVLDVIRDQMRLRREGLIMEVRVRNGNPESPLIVTVFSDFRPEEFDRVRRTLDHSKLFGQIEYHYSGGLHRVRVKTSLTREEYKTCAPLDTNGKTS